MKITLVHSFYSAAAPSGENVVVEEEAAMLAEAGHDVTLVGVHTDNEREAALYELRSAIRVMTGTGGAPMDQIPADTDVLHVHNTFPNIGWRTLARWQGPIVHTLHNFRPLCANGLLFRDGAPCFECVEGSRLHSLAHRCYRNSYAATLPLTLRINASGGGLLGQAQALVIGGEAAADAFVLAGIPREKLHVIPHGVPDPSTSLSSAPRRGFVFAGRMDAAKGVTPLLSLWPADVPLHLYGDGPEVTELARTVGPQQHLFGSVPRDELRRRISESYGVVVPSQCLEVNPTVVAEALSTGTPIIARAGNAAADVVARHGVGAVYWDAASLEEAIRKCERTSALAVQCLDTYRHYFSAAAWLGAISEVYAKAAAEYVRGAAAVRPIR